MPDVQKYSLIDLLNEIDKKYTGSPALLGMSGLTYPSYINSMRVLMFTAHTKQYLTPLKPEFPFLFTGMENVVGENSDAFKKAKHDLEVYRKIEKYGDILEEPNTYLLFVFDKKKEKYDLIIRKDTEDLTENFGFQYNNEVIDSFDEGDTIASGTILYKSSSYDEDMNYAYGKNVCTMLTLDPYTTEDAAEVSESLHNEFTSIETETITIGLNDNDYLLNIYGDKETYKPLPDIGESFDGILAAVRKLFKNQMLFDFNDKNLRRINDSDMVFSNPGRNEVIDIEIFSNNDERIETPFMEQINRYLDSQTKFYKEVIKTCEEIMDSGYKFSNEIRYWYKRAQEMINIDPFNSSVPRKWKEGDKAFSNIIINVQIKKVAPLAVGYKIAGRFGNKSVISKVVSDDEMPFTADGRRVDLKINLLALINRTTGELIIELVATSIAYQIRRKMKELKTMDKKVKLLFDFLYEWNEEQYSYMKKDFDSMDKKEQKAWIEDTIENGIYLNQPPLWESKPVFYRIKDILQKFPFLQPEDVYINKFGRKVKTLSKRWIGYMYTIKLKQTDRRGFSSRSTGAIDTKSLPTRSYKSKSHTEKYSSTAVRFGEFETLAMSIGLSAEDMALFHEFYRSAPKARKWLVKSMFNLKEDGKPLKMDSSYTSRVAEIFNVYLKSLGLELDFVNGDDKVRSLSTSDFGQYEIDGVIHYCTEYEAFMYERIAEIKKEILSEKGVLTTAELDKEVERIMRERKYITGHLYDENGNIICE